MSWICFQKLTKNSSNWHYCSCQALSFNCYIILPRIVKIFRHSYIAGDRAIISKGANTFTNTFFCNSSRNNHIKNFSWMIIWWNSGYFTHNMSRIWFQNWTNTVLLTSNKGIIRFHILSEVLSLNCYVIASSHWSWTWTYSIDNNFVLKFRWDRWRR